MATKGATKLRRPGYISKEDARGTQAPVVALRLAQEDLSFLEALTADLTAKLSRKVSRGEVLRYFIERSVESMRDGSLPASEVESDFGVET